MAQASHHLCFIQCIRHQCGDDRTIPVYHWILEHLVLYYYLLSYYMNKIEMKHQIYLLPSLQLIINTSWYRLSDGPSIPSSVLHTMHKAPMWGWSHHPCISLDIGTSGSLLLFTILLNYSKLWGRSYARFLLKHIIVLSSQRVGFSTTAIPTFQTTFTITITFNYHHYCTTTSFATSF